MFTCRCHVKEILSLHIFFDIIKLVIKMIYLDYSATTPVLHDVLDSYIKTSKNYIGNVNSIHKLGIKSKELLDTAKKQMADLLNVKEKNIIFTSGSTEANNIALISTIKGLNKTGEIIVSKLEHPSIYDICKQLEKMGNKIIYVNNTPEGVIDFEDLKNKVNKNTIMISICAVNSELGIRQHLKTISQIDNKENKNVIFHSDMTQAIGKVPINLNDVDLATASAHKIYGPKGIGFLYKKENIKLEPLLFGSDKYGNFVPGTPPLPLIVSFSKALRLSLHDLSKKEIYVKKLNDKIVDHLKQYENIKINQTKYSIPHILNISLMNIKSETFVHALEEKDVYISTTTACTKGTESISVMALYNDELRASTTLRISISYLTTNEEIKKFLNYFDIIYESLNLKKA